MLDTMNMFCMKFSLSAQLKIFGECITTLIQFNYLWTIFATHWTIKDYKQTIVFQNRQKGSYHAFDVNYLNPVIFCVQMKKNNVDWKQNLGCTKTEPIPGWGWRIYFWILCCCPRAAAWQSRPSQSIRTSCSATAFLEFKLLGQFRSG